MIVKIYKKYNGSNGKSFRAQALNNVDKVSVINYYLLLGFLLTSWSPCWCTLNKRILIISFVWVTNMAAMSIVFGVSWDCVKTKN